MIVVDALHVDASSWYKKEIFYSENIQLLEQPPQWHSGIPIAGGFSDKVAQGDR